MIGMRFTTSSGLSSFKNAFFDREDVIKKVGRARVKVLSKMGAYVRQTDKSSIRKRKRVSREGEPPSSHEGSLKARIYFAYDSGSDTVIVGAAKFRRGNVPELMEKGGRSQITGNIYKPRPHTYPAYLKELPKFTPLWRDSVKP